MTFERHCWTGFMALVFGTLIAGTCPTMGQDNAIEISPGTAKVLKFDRSVSTVVVGDPKIADALPQDDNTIILTAKKPGKTNLIVLGTSNNEILNAPVIVSESATKGDGRVTLHATSGRGGLQKFYVYRCARGRLCEIVKEPEVVIQRDTRKDEDDPPPP
jgi:Flp pilus assembly secretin CpaC